MANSAFEHAPSFNIPGSTTDNAVIRWDGSSGSGQLNSGVTIDDSNNLTVPGYLYLSGDEKELRFYEGSNFVAIKTNASLAGDYTLTLPLNDGGSGEFLQTNGSGVLTWASATASAVAPDNAIQYNSGSTTFAGSAAFTFDGTNNVLLGGTTGAKQLKIETTSTNALAELQLKVGANATAGGGVIRFYEGTGLGTNNNMGLQLEYVAGTLSISSSGSTGTHSYGAGGWRIRSAETQSNFFVGSAYEVSRDLLVIPNGYTAVLKPYQPSFIARMTANQSHSDGSVNTLQFNSGHYGPGNCYNETGSTSNTIPAYSFKAPVTGLYLFTSLIIITSLASGAHRYEIRYTHKNSSGTDVGENFFARPYVGAQAQAGEIRESYAQLIYMAKDDSVSCLGGPYGGTCNTASSSWFAGVLLG